MNDSYFDDDFDCFVLGWLKSHFDLLPDEDLDKDLYDLSDVVRGVDNGR